MALLALVTFALPPSSARADDEPAPPSSGWEEYEAGWARPGYQRVRNARVERPLTTPRRTFDVYVSAALRAPSVTEERFLRLPVEYRDQGPRLGLRLGSLYGITDDLEVGVLFPPMVFRNGVEFDGPVFDLAYRVIGGGMLELAVIGSVVIPVANDLGVGGRVPLRVHLGGALRLDAVPELMVWNRDRRGYANAALPVTLVAQLGDEWSAGLSAGVSTLGFETAAMSTGAELTYTVTSPNGAVADLSLGFAFPTLIDGSGRGVSAETAHWVVSLGARFFVRLPQDRDQDRRGDL
jgi:hypothetical protein